MSSKTTWTLWLLAGALFAFIVLFERHLREPGDVVARPRILPRLVVSAVTSLQVTPAGKLSIRADRTNTVWRLTKPLSYPAEPAAVDALLAALAQLNVGNRLTAREVNARPNPDQEFGLDPPQFTLLLQQGDYTGQVLIGGWTALKDQLFLQVVGTEGIFLVDGSLWRLLPQTPDDWRSATFVNLAGLAFDRITVSNIARGFELERDAPGRPWRLARPMQARADNPKIAELLQRLEQLRVTRFVTDDPKADLDGFGLLAPDLSLALAQGTNPVAVLQFGRSPTNAASQVYARRADRPTIGLVPAEPLAPWRGPYTDFRDRHLVTLTPDAVEEIEIAARGGETNLVRRLTNEVWQVIGTNGFAAEPALVGDLLGSLSTLEVAQFVKDVVTPLDFPGYGLQPPALQVILRAAPNAPGAGTNRVIVELQFGTVQNGLVYARRADENSVYAVTLRDFQRVPLAAWQLRDLHLWRFSENDVARLTLRLPDKTLELTRTGTNQWTIPAGAPGGVNELALDECLHRLGGLTATAWVARGADQRPRFGFSDRSLTLTVELKSGAKASVEFGGRSPRGFPYAATQLDGQTWIFDFPWSVYEYLQTALPGF